ncbi:MAG: hypothetical protein M3340_02825 [Actinomycetota bacterium]|nr:hypothetical protein [Actinomycetota bacterium]
MSVVSPPRSSLPPLVAEPEHAEREPAPARRRDPDRRFRRALIAVAAIAVGLRVLALFAYWPAFLGYPDTAFYVAAANEGAFADPFRPGGYPELLSALHWSGITGTVLVQHLLGLATGALMFLVVRRIGGSRWVALFPAAAVGLCGSQVMIEHALLSESVFAFLVAAAVYACVRALDDGFGWIVAAGLLIGAAAPIRLVALSLIPVLALWMALAMPRRRVLSGLVLAATAAAIPLAWSAGNEAETGQFGLTRTGGYNLYGRVGPFADCDRFDPPAGTRMLCPKAPVERRRSTYFFIFVYASPAVWNFGHPQGYPEPTDRDVTKLRRFARAAIVAQPLDYARTVAKDSFRYIAPSWWAPPPNDANQTPEELNAYYTAPGWSRTALYKVRGYYDPDTKLTEHTFLLDALRWYERVTRFSGVAFLLILLAALAAPFVLRGRARAGAALLLATGLTLLLVPAATIFYDYRFAIPALGSLTAAAALGMPGLHRNLGRLRRLRSAT